MQGCLLFRKALVFQGSRGTSSMKARTFGVCSGATSPYSRKPYETYRSSTKPLASSVYVHVPEAPSPHKRSISVMSLRQVSFAKEEETRTLKPFAETLRVRIPPGKAGPAARSESCVVLGRPILRSVDREVKGRVIEPRKLKTRGAFVVDIGGGPCQATHSWSTQPA